MESGTLGGLCSVLLTGDIFWFGLVLKGGEGWESRCFAL